VVDTWDKHPEVQSALLHVSRGCRRDSFWMDYDEVTSKNIIVSALILHVNAAQSWKRRSSICERGVENEKDLNVGSGGGSQRALKRMSIEAPPRPTWAAAVPAVATSMEENKYPVSFFFIFEMWEKKNLICEHVI